MALQVRDDEVRRSTRSIDSIDLGNAQHPDFTDISQEQLVELMNKRGKDASDHVESNFRGLTNIVRHLHTSTKQGIIGFRQSLKLRQQTFGYNTIPLRPPENFAIFLFKAVMDWLLVVLLLWAVVSVILGIIFSDGCAGSEDWAEGVGIIGTAVVMILVSAVSDYLRDQDFRCQEEKINCTRKITVMRSKKRMEILSRDLVVGDVCLVKRGVVVPGDGVIIENNGLVVDETIIPNSQGNRVKKSQDDILVFSGSHVVEGNGKFITLAVGSHTQVAAAGNPEYPAPQSPGFAGPSANVNIDTAALAEQEENTRVSLQAKLNRAAVYLGYIGIAVAVITVIVIIIRYSIYMYHERKLDYKPSTINEYIRAIIMGLVVLIIAVPEGLPLAFTFSLAYCVRHMYHDRSLVRHVDVVESMGNITAICCNKTGVITQNRQHVAKSWLIGELNSGDPRTYMKSGRIPVSFLDNLGKAIAINTYYSSLIEPAGSDNLPVQTGNKTDCSVLQFILEYGDTYQPWRDEFTDDRHINRYDFTSERKFMATVIKEKGLYRMFVKGAPEIILEQCVAVDMGTEDHQIFSKIEKEKLLHEVIDPMQSEGLRTLCLAYKDFPAEDKSGKERVPDWDYERHIITDLILQGVFGIEDPVRDEVPEAIATCRKAGISVHMVSGDNIVTAKAVALKSGIMRPDGDSVVYTGKDFNDFIRDPDGTINKDRFDNMWPQLRVLARSTPRDKYTLVKGMQESKKRNPGGELVSVTGSNVNDGPVLMMADVGFTMGVAGTDVAKEAADVILLNDDFGSIVTAVKWGRTVYDNMIKFLQFQFTVSWVAIFVIFIGVCILGRSPLTACQMLWVNLIMDSLASFALSRDHPTDDILDFKPFGRNKPLIARTLLRNVLGHSIYQIIVLFILIFLGADLFDVKDGFKADTICKPTQHSSIVFTTFVFMQLFNEINSRRVRERHVFKGLLLNYFFIIIWLSCVVIQILMVQLFGSAFRVLSMDDYQWCWCLLLGFSELLWAQLVFSIPKEVVPSCLRCVSTGIHEGTKVSPHQLPWIRGTGRTEQQNRGAVVTLQRSASSATEAPPPYDYAVLADVDEDATDTTADLKL